MAEQFSVEAVLSAVDKNFSSVMGNAENSLSGLSRSANSTQGSVGKASNGMFASMKSMAGAMGLVAVGAKAFDVVRDSVGGAIERFDTLNQYPKVMQMLGYSMKDTAASTKILKAGIDGLPTSLQEITGMAQQLAPLTGSATKAAQSAIALNNAFLASGASTEKASRGLEQYTQMLSTGKVDMDAWTTLCETMGPALDKVAQSFGFAGKSAKMDLFNALKDGSITIDQLNDKFIELNKGSNGFAKQAKVATEGIQTSFKNLRNSVVNNLEEMITKIDQGFQNAGFGSIAQVLDNMKGAINGAFQTIGPVVTNVTTTVLNGLKTLFDFINQNKDWLMPLVIGITAFLGTTSLLNTGINVVKGALTAISNISAFAGLIKESGGVIGALKTIGTLIGINPWVLLAAAIAAVVAGLVWFFTQTETGRQIWQSFVEWLKNAWNSLKETATTVWEWITQTFKKPIAIIQAAWSAVKEFFSNLWNGIKETASNVWSSFLEGMAPIIEALKALWEPVKEFFTLLWEGIKAVAQLAWQGILAILTPIVAAIMAIWTPLTEFFSTLWSGITSIFSTVWQAVVTVFQGVWTTITTIIQTAWTIISTLVSTAINVVASIIKTVLAVIKGDWQGAWNEVKNIFQTVGNAIKQIGQALMDALKAVFKAGWNTAKGVFQKGVEACKKVLDVANELRQIGRNFVQGFINGITEKIEDAVKAVRSLGRKAVDAAKEFFKIGSPSKLMQQYGQWFTEGFAIGIADSIGDVVSAATKMAKSAIVEIPSPKVGSLDTASLQASLSGLNANVGGNFSNTVTMNDATTNMRLNNMENLLHQLVAKSGDVYMDGRSVGHVVAPTVSQDLGQQVMRKGRWS